MAGAKLIWLTAGKAQVELQHFRTSPQYMLAPQSPFTKGPQVPWKGSWESLRASLREKPRGLTCSNRSHALSGWRVGDTSEPQLSPGPHLSVLIACQTLRDFVFLYYFPLLLETNSKAYFEYESYHLLEQTFPLGVGPFPTSSLCSCVLVKAQAPAKPFSTGVISDVLL